MIRIYRADLEAHPSFIRFRRSFTVDSAGRQPRRH
jgi:hypothetical protein